MTSLLSSSAGRNLNVGSSRLFADFNSDRLVDCEGVQIPAPAGQEAGVISIFVSRTGNRGVGQDVGD